MNASETERQDHNDQSSFLDEFALRSGERRRMEKLKQAMRLATLELPYLSILAANVTLLLDNRVDTAAVTPTGRILVNNQFLDSLTLRETVFVVAHEIYHLVLQTHSRGEESDRRLVNIAHDLIINDILENELHMEPAAGGVRFAGARHMSLEHLLVQLRQLQKNGKLPATFWRQGTGNDEKKGLEGPLRSALANHGPESDSFPKLAGGLDPVKRSTADRTSSGDHKGGKEVLNSAEELELFPADIESENADRAKWVLEAAIECVALSALQIGWQHDAGHYRPPRWSDRAQAEIAAMQSVCRVQWERVVQQWFDAHTPQSRSYSRASRRAGDRTDVVLPGRHLESMTVHVILDTSGSMWTPLPVALGALALCCQATGVEYVRIVQCDLDVTVDEVIESTQLKKYAVTGFGGWEGTRVPQELERLNPPANCDSSKEEIRKEETPTQSQSERRRRNRVYSKRVQTLTQPSGNRKRKRWKPRRGDLVWVRLRHPENLSKPRDLRLDHEKQAVTISRRSAPDSNLAPALRKLATEPNVESVLVLTDGEIEFPAEAMPYDILWLIHRAEDGTWANFEPEYGQVARLETDVPQSENR